MVALPDNDTAKPIKHVSQFILTGSVRRTEVAIPINSKLDPAFLVALLLTVRFPVSKCDCSLLVFLCE
jgi:hypothetical protein